MGDQLKAFVEAIFSIASRGMGGSGIGTTLIGAATTAKNGSTSHDDMVLALEKSALTFAGAYRDAKADLQPFAKEVEGALMGLQTMGLLAEKDVEGLLGELDKLMKRRK